MFGATNRTRIGVALALMVFGILSTLQLHQGSSKASNGSRTQDYTAPARAPKLTVTTLATREQLAAEWSKLKDDPQVAPHLSDRYEVLSLTQAQAAEHDKGADDKPAVTDPELYVALVFDYTHNRLLKVTGRIGQSQPVEVREEDAGMVSATDEEYQAAVNILMQNPRIAEAVAKGELELFRAMPGVFEMAERTLAVGLKPRAPNQAAIPEGIVAVNLVKQGGILRGQQVKPAASINEFIRSAEEAGEVRAAAEWEAADPTELAVMEVGAHNCEPPPEATDRSSNANETTRFVQWGNWTFVVVRPKDSEPKAPNGRGGAVELRSVFFKGKKVLHQAHVPILTVKYNLAGRNCGPYRDWLDQESQFTAQSAGAGIGSPNPARTILETESDQGNFNGVAIWQEWDSALNAYRLVVASEMAATWYRYAQKWIFYDNGRLIPQFGFAAVQNRCTCINHTHHVYWRFDFDVVSSRRNSIREYIAKGWRQNKLTDNSAQIAADALSFHENPPTYSDATPNAAPGGQDQATERRRYREHSAGHSYRILNTVNPAEYVTLYANAADGRTNRFTAGDPFNQNGFADGDVWFLRWHGSSEIHDGVRGITGTDALVKPRIDNWVNGEAINQQDLVLWYGAHFWHDDEHGHTPANPYVGPTILINW
jgi:hypothetical protein